MTVILYLGEAMKIFAMVGVFLLLGSGAFGANEEAPILRMVKVKGTIYKNFVERTPDSIRVRSEKVCDFQGETIVYNLRVTQGENKFINPRQVAKCASTMGGVNVDARIRGFVSEGRWSAGDLSEVKLASASLGVSASDEGNVSHRFLHGTAGTKDLKNSSIVLNVYDFFSNGDGPSSEEIFSASLEFVDDQQ
jgi:hypothetical protein